MTPSLNRVALASPGVRRSWHRYRQEWFVGAYAVAYVVALSVAPRDSARWMTFVNALYFVFGLVTVVAHVRLARDPEADRRTRRAWALLAAASLAVLAGGILWTFSENGQIVVPKWLEWLQTAHAPLATIAFLTFPADPRVTLRDSRVRIDAILLAVGAGALSWFFTLQPLLHSETAGQTATTLVTFALDWLTVLAASIAYLRSRHSATRGAVSLLLGAHVMFVLSDFVWLKWQATYTPGHWLDAMWFIAWGMRWAAARFAHHRGRVERRATRHREQYRSGIAPSIFVAGAYTLLVFTVLRGEAIDAVAIGFVATVMTGLLLARQGAELEENRRLAQATMAQTARYRSIVAHASDFVMVVNNQLEVVYVSPSVTQAGIATIGASFGQLVHPGDVDGVQLWLARLEHAPTVPHQCRLLAGAERWIDVELRAQDLNDDPHVRGFVINGRDISDEVALEARLRQAHKLAALHDLAGRIAHAYNNSLASIQGHAELLAQESVEAGAATEEVDAIRCAAERGAGITRQLLGFSGRHVIQPVLLEPAIVLGDLMPTFVKLLPTGIDLQIDAGHRGVHVVFDRAQLEQVLVNLVANARDAMPNGGTVRVSTRVAADGEAGRVILEVSDTGTGIPDHLRSRIFEPFFTTKSPGHGTGLGLAMVQTIVTRAHGTIAVLSERDRGSTFTVSLPMAKQRAVITVPKEARVPSTGTGVVLLVDDEPAVLRASRRMLERAGFEVIEASSGAAAIAAMRQPGHLDVLVTDYMMRHVSGRDVIEAFRTARPGVPVICITGFAAESDDAAPLALEVHAIVAKPFSSAVLVSAVSSAIASAARPLRASR
ncbi:MAG: hybrid sensor histidine kinase/response regulator [Gemmatimonadaceae bacterium]